MAGCTGVGWLEACPMRVSLSPGARARCFSLCRSRGHHADAVTPSSLDRRWPVVRVPAGVSSRMNGVGWLPSIPGHPHGRENRTSERRRQPATSLSIDLHLGRIGYVASPGLRSAAKQFEGFAVLRCVAPPNHHDCLCKGSHTGRYQRAQTVGSRQTTDTRPSRGAEAVEPSLAAHWRAIPPYRHHKLCMVCLLCSYPIQPYPTHTHRAAHHHITGSSSPSLGPFWDAGVSMLNQVTGKTGTDPPSPPRESHDPHLTAILTRTARWGSIIQKHTKSTPCPSGLDVIVLPDAPRSQSARGLCVVVKILKSSCMPISRLPPLRFWHRR